jgi:hypothetical protein
MAVIIGAGTTVNVNGVVSISWDYQPNIERLWELGSFSPFQTRQAPTRGFNMTTYPGDMDIPSGPPSDSCVDSTSVYSLVITPAACTTIDTVSGDFFITSYSYSKGDPNSVAQESWAGQEWLESDYMPEPDYVLRGISEGTYNGTLTAAEMGITGGTVDASGQTGSVSAGFPGIGQADDIYYISNVTSVGTGVLGDTPATGAGKYGNASISIPHTPLWLGT